MCLLQKCVFYFLIALLVSSQLPDDFSFGLYDLDWNVFSPHYESAINQIPAIENVGVKSTVCGPGDVLQIIIECITHMVLFNTISNEVYFCCVKFH